MTKLENLQRQLSRLQEQLFALEMYDDWCYTNGSADKLELEIANLRKEITLEKLALEK